MKSNTRSIQGDAHLSTLIDPFSFLNDDEDFLEEEIPEDAEEGPPQ